ncbi:hypothetical protein RSAG8_09757, partial [Rhizoctonia solani AG-8 WAC10335]
MLVPEPPTPPAMAIIREGRPVHAPNVATQPSKRPVTVFDADNAYGLYGGMYGGPTKPWLACYFVYVSVLNNRVRGACTFSFFFSTSTGLSWLTSILVRSFNLLPTPAPASWAWFTICLYLSVNKSNSFQFVLWWGAPEFGFSVK